MKVVQIVPILPSAITVLARQIINYSKDAQIKLATFHPKKPSGDEIKLMKKHLEWADVVDCQYWKSGSKVRELMPDLWKRHKRKILTHYNPYNLHEESWEEYRKVCVVNQYQKGELPNAKLMPLCIDLKKFPFTKWYNPEPAINMTASRIEATKGILEIAKACRILDFKFLLVGRISKAAYFEEVAKAAGSNLEFHKDVSDKELVHHYHQSSIHVCNSKDGFESGTLPVLEAMSCGIPVIARKVGHVPDLYDGNNMRIFEGPQNDVEGWVNALKHMQGGRRTLISMRIAAAETVKKRDAKWRAHEYEELYKEVMNK